jgi:hypothetical protein
MPGIHTEDDDICDVIAHVADGTCTHINEWYEPSPPLALDCGIVPPNRACRVLLRVALVKLEAIFGGDLLPQLFSRTLAIGSNSSRRGRFAASLLVQYWISRIRPSP